MATRRAGGHRPARERAVEIEMGRCAVDLDEGLRFDGGLEQAVVIELVARAIRNKAIGWMRDHRDQRVPHRGDIACQELLGRMAMALVQRGEHDVELLED